MIIRRATENDVSAIVQMLADDDLGSGRESYKEPLPVAYTKAFKNIQKDPNQELMVVDNEKGEIIGSFQLSFIQYLTYQGGTRAQIESVRIRKDHRGGGLGTQMFEWAIKRAKEKGAHVLQLTTDKKRPAARQFYESLGFVASHHGMKLHLRT
jgi:GNAT superfamily N-acetyltransferase